MSKLIHITAPNSSTGEERAAEEKRVARMFPGAGVVCLLEGWSIAVYEISAPKSEPKPLSIQFARGSLCKSDARKIVHEAMEDASENIGSLA